MGFIDQLGPLGQVMTLLVLISFAFLLLVNFLDRSDNFALKRDWRDEE